MKVIKLTKEEIKRSLKSKKVDHLWLYSRQNTRQRTHNNSILLTRTIGIPVACIVVLRDTCICDEDIEKVFGKGIFIDGAVSPEDKENINYDCYYCKSISNF